MAKGLAVAGYAIGALPEIVGRGDNSGTTLEETASLIARLLNDPEHRAAEGKRNQERAVLFSIETMINKCDQLCAGLVVPNGTGHNEGAPPPKLRIVASQPADPARSARN
jgi:hypothetical protein